MGIFERLQIDLMLLWFKVYPISVYLDIHKAIPILKIVATSITNFYTRGFHYTYHKIDHSHTHR